MELACPPLCRRSLVTASGRVPSTTFRGQSSDARATPYATQAHRGETIPVSEAFSALVASRPRESADSAARPEQPLIARPESYGASSEPLLSVMPDPSEASPPAISEHPKVTEAAAASAAPVVPPRLASPGLVQGDPQLGRLDSAPYPSNGLVPGGPGFIITSGHWLVPLCTLRPSFQSVPQPPRTSTMAGITASVTFDMGEFSYVITSLRQ